MHTQASVRCGDGVEKCSAESPMVARELFFILECVRIYLMVALALFSVVAALRFRSSRLLICPSTSRGSPNRSSAERVIQRFVSLSTALDPNGFVKAIVDALLVTQSWWAKCVFLRPYGTTPLEEDANAFGLSGVER